MATRYELSQFLTTQSQMLQVQHHVGGTPATIGNNIQVSAFKVAWLYLASDVSSLGQIHGDSLFARLENFTRVLKQFDLMDLLNLCSAGVELLLSHDVLTYETFKGFLVSTADSELVEGLLSPISPILCRYYDDAREDSEALKLCLQFLRYGKKLHLEAIGLEEKTLALYLETEDRLARLELDEDTQLILGLNRIMKRWLRKLDLRDLVPNHGGGSVAEGKLTLYEKYKQLRTDLMLRVVLNNDTISYYGAGFNASNDADLRAERDTEVVRVSRTIFVPKTYSKLRVISMEPVTLQYWQQSIMKRLYNFISTHRYLKHAIKLEDQTYNQNMARRGSLEDNLSTIDLSAASDSVKWTLVKRIFAKTPLLKWLYATRSNQTKLPDGSVIEMQKFAPMGSALCFPIQCLIFAAVIEYVTQRCCTANGDYPGYAVYGDDMVVAKGVTDEVIEALQSLGFLVNRDKTFTSGPFRESCGKDYHNGNDVSSIYFRFNVKHNFDPFNKNKRLSPEAYSAACSAINLCADYGYKRLRAYLIHMISHMDPYFTNRKGVSPHLYSVQATNFHVDGKKYWHKDYQKWVARFCTVLSIPRRRETKDGDDVAYFVKLAQMATRKKSFEPLNQDVVSVSLHGTTVKLGRVEREYVVPTLTHSE